MEAAVEQKAQTNPKIEMPAGELSRILKILTAKGGGGTPFPVIGLRVHETYLGFKNVVEAEYVGGVSGGNGIKAWFRVPGEVSPGEIATNDPLRLLDYIDSSTYGAEDIIRLSSQGDRIFIHGPKSRTSMGAAPPGAVQRTKFENAFSRGPSYTFVNTNPDSAPVAPVDGAPVPEDWGAWSQRGYFVALLKASDIAAMLRAGDSLHKMALSPILRSPGF